MFISRKWGVCGKYVAAKTAVALFIFSLTGCAALKSTDTYRDTNMDFGAIRTVAVLPFVNLTRDTAAAERVRDVFVTSLLASGGVYVIPSGEVSRGIMRAGFANPGAPSNEETIKFGSFIKVDAIITGVLKEYGEVRSGSAAANSLSLSVQVLETQTGRVVWSASTTKGGIGITDRLFGGGGEPMNNVTEKAADDLINKLFP